MRLSVPQHYLEAEVATYNTSRAKQTAVRMGDDSCSASELRRRYHMGGDLKDDKLTAPQLRARYGIKKNAPGRVPTCVSRSRCEDGVK